MVCPSCGVSTQAGQRFCVKCGIALATAEPLPLPLPLPSPFPAPDPATDPEAFDRVFETERFRIVEQTTPTVEQLGITWGQTTTDQVPVVTYADDAFDSFDGVSSVGEVPLRVRTATVVLSAMVATLALAVPFVRFVRYSISGDVFADVSVRGNGFTTNAAGALIVGAVVVLAGSFAGMRGHRVGTGVAGGAGLAIAGLALWLVGQAVALVDNLKHAMTIRGGNYRLVTTMDLGVFLALAAAVIGIAVFVLAVYGIRDDGEGRVHPAVGALGVLGTMMIAIGSMLPMHSGTLAGNFNSKHPIGATNYWKAWVELTIGVHHEAVPPLTTWLRVLLVVFIALGGVLGFLVASRGGLGLAVGSISVSLCIWVATVFKWGDFPFGIAGGNPGSLGFTPHLVTSIGVVVVLVAATTHVVLIVRPDLAEHHTSLADPEFDADDAVNEADAADEPSDDESGTTELAAT